MASARTYEERLDFYNNQIKGDVQGREESLLGTVKSHRISDAMSAELAAHQADFEQCSVFAQKGIEELHLHCTMEPETAWTAKMLAKKCGLMVDGTKMIESNDQSSTGGATTAAPVNAARVAQDNWSEVIALSKILNTMKNRPDMSAKQGKFLDEVQAKFRSVHFEKRDLRRISNALQLKLSEEIEHQTVTTDVTKHSHAVEKLQPDLANCEHLLHTALENGDMALAEDISENQVTLLERLLDVTEEQYPMLQARRDQAKEFVRRRRWNIFRMANRDINGVIEMKARMVENCQEAVNDITEFHTAKRSEDLKSRDAFRSLMAESDSFLEGTASAQREGFEKLQRLRDEVRQTEEHLAHLGSSRAAEMRRRIEQCEAEAVRVSEHASLLRCSNNAQNSLRTALDNAEKVQSICTALNDFLMDGCDNITLKFEKSEATINSLISSIDKQYLHLFSEYAVCAGRLKYRKEMRRRQLHDQETENKIQLEYANDTYNPQAKKFADTRKQCEDQVYELTRAIENLEDKLTGLGRRFALCAASLEEQGIRFIHPLDLLRKANAERQTQVVDYREMVNLTEVRVEEQLSDDLRAVQSDFEDHRLAVLRKQGATHRRQMDRNSASRHPRVPQSQTERFQAASFNRYQQLIKTLSAKEQEEEKPPVASTGTRPGSAAVKVPTPPKNVTAGPISTKLEGETVIALYSYKPRAADELGFSKGDNIICIKPGNEAGWYLGVCNQRTGLFPLNYISTRLGGGDGASDAGMGSSHKKVLQVD